MREGWTETTLGDVAEWFSGGTPKAGKPEFYENGTIPWVVIADMMKTEIFDTASKITKAGLAEIGGRVAPKDSVLISMYATVGRPGFAHIPVATNQAIAWSVPNEKMIQPRFLLLVAQFLESEISSMARGATQRNINRAMLKEFSFNLPPLDEQGRIVDVVTSVDAYIDALQQQVVSARVARNAVLHELLSVGSDDWTETTLGDIAKCAGGTGFPHEFQGGETGTPFVKVSDMNESGNELFLNSSNNYLSKEAIKSLGARVWPAGTIVFAKVGAALLTEKRRILVQDTIFDNNIMGLVPKASIESHFLYLFMETVKLGDYVQPGAVPSINNSIVSEIAINLPPLDEQKRIVGIVSSMDEVIRSTEQAVVDAKNLRSGLLSDLLSGNHEIPASFDSLLGAA